MSFPGRQSEPHLRHHLALGAVVLAATLLTSCGDDTGSSGTDGGPGMAVCELTGGEPSPGSCGAAPVALSVEICRCGSRWYWSGTACVPTAACRCTAGCELLYETADACGAAYAECTGDGGASP